MKKSKSSAFWFGFLIAFFVGVVVWYWQKSTSADDGALDLLDELAKARAKIRDLQGGGTNISVPLPAAASRAVSPSQNDDLTTIRGIGPVYARRLQEAGITTFAELATHDPQEIGQIVQIKAWQAASPAVWIAQAKELSA